MILETYQKFGGVHPETSTLTNVLFNQGFRSSYNDRPLSEEMIFGIAGGLGCGYILWEFKKFESAILMMGFQNRWNYTQEFIQNLCNRIGVQADFTETGGQKTAQTHLEESLEDGKAPIVWIDQESLPYFNLRPMYNGCFGHFVTAFGLEDGQVWVDDRAIHPFQVKVDAFSQARARIGSYKNRLLTLNGRESQFDLSEAIRDGIKDCIEHLGRDSQTFAIPVYKKWASLMLDTKNKKGWPVVFKEGKGLYSTLRSLHEGVKLFGTKGGGLRRMYGDFLVEASPILGNSGLLDAGNQYKVLGDLWAEFADAVLPDHISPLGETRKLLGRKYEVFHELGGQGLSQVKDFSDQLSDMEAELNSNLPMSESEKTRLFTEIKERLYELYDAENVALETLREVMS